MPMYEYECPTHGRFTTDLRGDKMMCRTILAYDVDADGNDLSIRCRLMSKRKWGFRMQTVMQETFSAATGTTVTSKRQLAEQLKIKSEEADRRSLEGSLEFKRAADEQGIDIGDFQPREIHHNFVPTEDPAQIGLTDEVKEQAKEHATNSGRRDPKLYG